MLKALQAIKKTSIEVRVVESGIRKCKEFWCFGQPWNWQLRIHSLTKDKITYLTLIETKWAQVWNNASHFYLSCFRYIVNSTITKTFLGLDYVLFKGCPWIWLIYIVYIQQTSNHWLPYFISQDLDKIQQKRLFSFNYMFVHFAPYIQYTTSRLFPSC